MSKEITVEQQRLFQILLEKQATVTIKELVEQSGVEQSMIMGTMTFAKEQGWISIEEEVREELIPGEYAQKTVADGVPEKKFLGILKEHNEPMPMRSVAEHANKANIQMSEIMKWAPMRGWVEREQGNLKLSEAGAKALDSELCDDEKALKLAVERGRIFLDELSEDIDRGYVKKFLAKRSELAKIKERTVRKLQVTEEGKKELPQLKVKAAEKTQLTSEEITSGKWREIVLRSYDVTLAAEAKAPVKCHPFQKIVQETRRAFLEMGFSEIVSPHIESGFWNFDALFQPQDHPSRDMQDTFYMEHPGQSELPKDKIVEQVKKTHEDGWETNSKGWGYNWSFDEARKVVLRTHTTASTVRFVSNNPNPPHKVFCVGRVFRNETISFKHLPEFHQVDGIIIDKHASFVTLLGTLQAFYRKMGFEKVKFKPAFFPYTEPSAEVFVWMKQKNCWIELGGSGLFRPEVTEPLGCKVPVIAWGLGLERLAMLRYGISDIRTLYGSDLDWLQEVQLCQ